MLVYVVSVNPPPGASVQDTVAILPKFVRFPDKASRETVRKSLTEVARIVYSYNVKTVRFDDECPVCARLLEGGTCTNKKCPEGTPPAEVLRDLMKKYPPLDSGAEPTGAYFARLTAIWKGVNGPPAPPPPPQQ